ncbi:hypothetical protein RCL1_007849 [Eukaryota sp. TZLM3-RCL]
MLQRNVFVALLLLLALSYASQDSTNSTIPVANISRPNLRTFSTPFLLKVLSKISSWSVFHQSSTVLKSNPLPASYDVRTVVDDCPSYEILDQQQCGSCYAFAAVNVLGDYLCLRNEARVTLSPQHIVSCSDNLGCEGGTAPMTMDFIKKQGVVVESDFPYVSGQADFGVPTCPNLSGKTHYKAPDTGILAGLPDMEERMMRMLVERGTLFGMYIIFSDFIDYSSGIYKQTVPDNKDTNMGGHAVAIRGYGEEDGQKYWLVANSWGPTWGMEGYFKIAKGSNEATFETITAFIGPCPDDLVRFIYGACVPMKEILIVVGVVIFLLLCCVGCCAACLCCCFGRRKQPQNVPKMMETTTRNPISHV